MSLLISALAALASLLLLAWPALGPSRIRRREQASRQIDKLDS